MHAWFRFEPIPADECAIRFPEVVEEAKRLTLLSRNRSKPTSLPRPAFHIAIRPTLNADVALRNAEQECILHAHHFQPSLDICTTFAERWLPWAVTISLNGRFYACQPGEVLAANEPVPDEVAAEARRRLKQAYIRKLFCETDDGEFDSKPILGEPDLVSCNSNEELQRKLSIFHPGAAAIMRRRIQQSGPHAATLVLSK